ncbi:hypothetical protein F5Y15DRAFT_329851 [Xylariaceae sp. FL0016]|nr:hypothetical protein F5Y15DRAFT_329851 [Xylariaceae sp. FL0016]
MSCVICIPLSLVRVIRPCYSGGRERSSSARVGSSPVDGPLRARRRDRAHRDLVYTHRCREHTTERKTHTDGEHEQTAEETLNIAMSDRITDRGLCMRMMQKRPSRSRVAPFVSVRGRKILDGQAKLPRNERYVKYVPYHGKVCVEVPRVRGTAQTERESSLGRFDADQVPLSTTARFPPPLFSIIFDPPSIDASTTPDPQTCSECPSLSHFNLTLT